MWHRSREAMIRKAIIVTLACMAVVLGCLWVGDLPYDFPWEPPSKPQRARLGSFVRDGTIWLSYGVFWESQPSGVEILRQGRQMLNFSYWKISSWTGPQFSIPASPKCFDGYIVSSPIWFLFALFASYPTIAFIRGPLRRWRRRRRGLCQNCGYDLTGNESGVCPECGTEIEKP